MAIKHLYLDLDGVFANSAKRIEELLKKPYAEVTAIEFWNAVEKDAEFFLKLERIEDSFELYENIKHIPHTFLTGLPTVPRMVMHKKAWVDVQFPGCKMIATRGKLKHLYAGPEGVLIDDTKRNIDNWNGAGGIGILHKSANNTLEELKQLQILA